MTYLVAIGGLGRTSQYELSHPGTVIYRISYRIPDGRRQLPFVYQARGLSIQYHVGIVLGKYHIL